MKFNDISGRDTILYVGSYFSSQRQAQHKLEEILDRKLHALVLIDDKKGGIPSIAKDPFATVLVVSSKSEVKLSKALKPYEGKLLAVTARAESNIPQLRRILPHIPYVYAPTAESLEWSTQKIMMRKLLKAYDQSITPKFVVVRDYSEEVVAKIEKIVGYPVVVKPSGLAASLLVTICYHRDELEEALQRSIRKIRSLHKKKGGRGEPQLLVEQFMEGSMYSIDAYVNHRGVIYFCPPVHISTGRSVGYDDFFGYKQFTPVKLKPHKIQIAQETTEKAIRALNLRSTSVHAELMKTEEGWKIIELGPRIGGYRQKLYRLTTGMNHSLNDILIRIPKKPIIPKKRKGYAVAMKLYAKREGRLDKILGRKKVRGLESFKSLKVNKEKGDMCTFAKNGGDPIMEVIMFNVSRSKLLADIRRLEKSVIIEIKRRTNSIK